MEAATVAWHHMGWQPVGFSEIEPFPSSILKHHYPKIPNYGDLTQYKQWPLERGSIDLLVGGTPCQAFSVAGLRKGLDDPRGNLALTFLGLADHLRPKYILWENVPGVLSSSGGRDFGSFIGALAELGYGFAWRVCDAQYFGVPQRRKRVFLLAIEGAGNWRTAAEILFERKSMSGDFKESNQKGEGTSSDAGASVDASCKLFDKQAIAQYGDNGVASTCAARDYKDATDLVVPVVLDRAAFNQGQNAQYEPLIEQTETCPTIVSKGPHAVQIPFRKSKRATSTTDNETWVEGDVSNTLNNFDLGDTRTTHAVVYENHPNDSRVTGPHEIAPTVTSRFGTGGGNVPFVNEEPVKPLMFKIRGGSETNTGEQGGTVGQSAGKVYLGSEDKAFTVANVQDQWLSESKTMAVRRLTPVECERLQGFPDNYSQIPWKGKPPEQCPDGPRYKACGNSMAVPVMRWIGERIAIVDATLLK